METKINDDNTNIAYGGVSGYVNTETELKTSPSGAKYLSILLGRGKDDRGNALASYNIIIFGEDAQLFSTQIKKGDLVRFTSISLCPIVENGKTYASSFKLVGKDFRKICVDALKTNL
ncbi:single-stranded DNA-binding protein [Pseudomonas sp. NY15356]|jgi:hypothetical protein|uniref:single-stranded DNA-binding protein n=2 Tax=Pseudomonas TaxID=286 RepID=UPI0011DD68AC|nr:MULTISPECIES: single-stranded DNA-binding protein [Pseudomonas]MDM3891616.1 single-stranded DNA-binding protein [Pseudomonas juntendi]